MQRPLLLSVNIDHVATLRQARGTPYPTPLEAAQKAEAVGAAGITVHLRGDRRHVQDADVSALRQTVQGKLNLEMAATEEMLAIATALCPDQVTLVPERPEEVTTEGGLDLLNGGAHLRTAAKRLHEVGIDVSLFLDADPRQLAALAAQIGTGLVSGFEINTDRYTVAKATATAPATEELAAIRRMARDGAALGFRVYAGHGLTSANVGPVAAIPEIEELNIGHWLISRAVMVGIEAAVEEMLTAMAAGRD